MISRPARRLLMYSVFLSVSLLSGCEARDQVAQEGIGLLRQVLTIAEAHHREGKWGPPLLQDALRFADLHAAPDSLQAALHVALARAYLQVGNNAGARQHADRVATYSMHQPAYTFTAHYIRALSWARDSVFLAAQEAEAARAWAEAEQDTMRLMQAWWSTGFVHELHGAPQEALAAYEHVLHYADASKRTTEASIEAQFHAGHMLDQLGNHDDALARYRAAEENAAALGYLRFLAFAPYHQGRIFHDRFRDAERAMEQLETTVAIMRHQGLTHHFLLPIALQRLGDVHYDLLGDEDGAQSYYRKAAQIAQTHGHERFVRRALERSLP